MSRMNFGIAMALLGVAAASWTAPGVYAPQSVHGAPWRSKLKDTSTTVAASKRAARKRRNVANQIQARAEASEREAARYRWLRENCQPWANDNERPHALIQICRGEFQGGTGWFRAIGPESRVGIITLDAAIDAAMRSQGVGG